ncbi:YybS family protein [Falsibacillus pallidus]|uniref:YybS family protein n=1 Tax=Falsibacillus pallidus TaxID=493781 RepID=UPI003D96B392
MNQARQLTQGALMLAVYLVLLLITIYVPLVSLVANLFLIFPFLYYSAKHPVKFSLVLFIGALILSAVVGTVINLPLTIMYGTTGIAMGLCIRFKKSKLFTYAVSSFVILINLIVQYTAAVLFFNINFIDDTLKQLQISIDRSVNFMEKLGQTMDPRMVSQLDMVFGLFKTLMPSVFVLGAFSVAILLMAANFPLAKRFRVDVPAFKPFRQMQLPKSLLWYYLITIVISLLVGKTESGFAHSALLNVSFMLQTLFYLQGLSFIYFLCHNKNVPKAVAVILTIITFPVLYLVAILGMLDLGFAMRQRFQR